MRRWPASRSLWLWVGALVLVALLLLSGGAALLLAPLLDWEPALWQVGPEAFGLLIALIITLALAGGLLYRLASALSLAYRFDRNALVISWLGNRYVIPMDQIESIDIGASGAQRPWFGARLFGYHRGRGRLANTKPLSTFATVPLGACLVIYTPQAAYALSPRARDEFIQELEQRRGLGVIQTLQGGLEPSRYLNYAFWSDRIASALLMGWAVLNLVLWGVLAWFYAQLPPFLVLRLDPTGAMVQPRYHLLLMPLAALGIGLFNLALGLLLYQRERGVALVLQAASVLIELVCLAGLISVLVATG